MTQPQTGPGPTLIVLAAGASSRYGGLKQLEALGPTGEALLDFAMVDAARAGFSQALLVVREDLEVAFREHFDGYPPALPVTYEYQEVPGQAGLTSAAPGTTKPLGTAHAVLAARGGVAGPFAVVNADDFYGVTAYQVAAAFLAGVDAGSAHYAIVGYPLERTLSASGGVSRAVCETGPTGMLTAITEVLDVRRGEGSIGGVDPAGRSVELAGDETVSMNFWAFTPRVFAALEAALEAFLPRRQADAVAELHLPAVIGDEIGRGRARVEVLPAGSETFGITHAADRPTVESALRTRVERGEYPHSLAAHTRATPPPATPRP